MKDVHHLLCHVIWVAPFTVINYLFSPHPLTRSTALALLVEA
jgi:hypothetical protein